MSEVQAFEADILRLAGVRHGFLTRVGGASQGLYAGLNCGRGSDDAPAAVEENRRLAAAYINVLPENLISTYQIHSSTAVVVDAPFSPQAAPRADAIVTREPEIALGILTADCAPVLMADAEAGVIGAAHAGWRGALDGILGSTVSAMVGLGARRHSICAAVGPAISQRNYEVGLDFMDRFLSEDPEYDRFFSGAADMEHAMFNLPGFCIHMLRQEGVEADWIGRCTYDDEDRLFSYRRATHRGDSDYGRQLSVISLAGAASAS